VWKEPAEGMLAVGHLDERTGMKTFNLFNGETEEVPAGRPATRARPPASDPSSERKGSA
jgi:hypothetical protein